MVRNSVKIYGRLKPESCTETEETSSQYTGNQESGISEYCNCIANMPFNDAKKIEFYLTRKYHIYHLPESSADNLILTRLLGDPKTNKQEKLTFQFHKVFDRTSKQEDIFEIVVKPVVESVLHGYNGTVFAYGQTGSGKTFTITGGANKYEDRGIIPRSIQHTFQLIKQDKNILWTIYISYLEIYNEVGFDLLDPKHKVSKLEDFPHVIMMEDAAGTLHIRNLSLHLVDCEKEAINLLFMGDSNRVVAETPLNPYSSRSHCIFTIHLASRSVHSSMVQHSKLNIVDLAGSERVYKTQIDGKTLMEARHINLSLHFLEQVILALGEAGRNHIPYRNSIVTSILRDSLGGNCITVMIATLSLSKKNIEETLSTCRFSQRVALVRNEVNVNKELDPQEEIAMLRAEVHDLRSQLSRINGEKDVSKLDTEDVEECQKLVRQYLQCETETKFGLLPNEKKVQLCFSLLKTAKLEARQAQISQESKKTQLDEEYQRCLKQRDNEISILINLLKKERKRFQDYMAQKSKTGNEENLQIHQGEQLLKSKTTGNEENLQIHQGEQLLTRTLDSTSYCEELGKTLSKAELKGFACFMADPLNRLEFEKIKLALKTKYEEARDVASEIQHIQISIKTIQSLLKQNLAENNQIFPTNSTLITAQKKLEENQINYKKELLHLQNLKCETNHLKHGLQQVKLKLLMEFKDWWRNQRDYSSSNDIIYSVTSVSNDDKLSSSSSHSHLTNSLEGKENKETLLSEQTKVNIHNINIKNVENCTSLIEEQVMKSTDENSHTSDDYATFNSDHPIDFWQESKVSNNLSLPTVTGLAVDNDGQSLAHMNEKGSTFESAGTFIGSDYIKAVSKYRFSDELQSYLIKDSPAGTCNSSLLINGGNIGLQNETKEQTYESKHSESEMHSRNSDSFDTKNFKDNSPLMPVKVIQPIFVDNTFSKKAQESQEGPIQQNDSSNKIIEEKNQMSDFAEDDIHINNKENTLNAKEISHDMQYATIMENLPLTGDPEIDEEIFAFYKARSRVLYG